MSMKKLNSKLTKNEQVEENSTGKTEPSLHGEIIYKPQAVNNRKIFSSNPNSPDFYRKGLNINMNMNVPPTVRSPDFLKTNINFNTFNNGIFVNSNANQHHAYSSVSSSNNSITNSASDYMHLKGNNLNYAGLNGASVNAHGYTSESHNHNSINRRLSEHVYNKLKENPLQTMNKNPMNSMNMNNQMINNLRSPPVYLKVNPDVMFSNNPRNLMNLNSFHGNLSIMNNVGSSRSSVSQNYNLVSPPGEINPLDNSLHAQNMIYNEYSGVSGTGFLSPRSFHYNHVARTDSKQYQPYEGKRSNENYII